MNLPTVKINRENRIAGIILCMFFLIITIPILIASYNKRADDLKMYDYFECKRRDVVEILIPYSLQENKTTTVSCARLKLDPKIVSFGKAPEVLVGLYPFIIVAVIGLTFLMYQFASEGF